ncbi:hypothetical protein CCP2SC5_140035 [Azospirillaceae bacterium]
MSDVAGGGGLLTDYSLRVSVSKLNAAAMRAFV